MEVDNKQEIIVSEFNKNIDIYQGFTQKIEHLLKEILEINDINIHSISSRCKKVNSLRGKIEKNLNKYKYLSDVTDLSGVRIITYFSDDVDKIANIIEQEFEVDFKNSIDKRKILDPERFGYQSLHYVVKLNSDRRKLTEYSKYTDICSEIQLRTILQHTWAEIEHDLGYKSKLEIPNDVRRSFSRLAGLLEIADNEFLRIRDSLSEYKLSLNNRILEQPTMVLIDKLSLKSYIETNSKIIDIDNFFKDFGKFDDDVYLDSSEVDRLHELGLETISDIDAFLICNSELIKKFTTEWLNRPCDENEERIFSRGITLFYICYILLAQRNDMEFAIQYFQKYCIGSDAEELAEELFEIFNLVNNI